MRKLKFRLKREYLENIYFTFIRPILEYSSEVWDNCGQVNSDRLEKLQLEAARIVTGLTCYTSLDSIYREAGWEKLSTRREVKKLCMFYKLNVVNSPEFLCDLIPPSVGETNNYNLRNSHNISIPVNPPPFRGSLPRKSLISRMDWVSCAGDINLPHTPFPPPNKKIKYNKILTYILRSIFLEIPHLELPR